MFFLMSIGILSCTHNLQDEGKMTFSTMLLLNMAYACKHQSTITIRYRAHLQELCRPVAYLSLSRAAYICNYSAFQNYTVTAEWYTTSIVVWKTKINVNYKPCPFSQGLSNKTHGIRYWRCTCRSLSPMLFKSCSWEVTALFHVRQFAITTIQNQHDFTHR